MLKRGLDAVLKLADNARVRRELGWILGNRAVDFVVLFVTLKVLTTLLGKAEYGEYGLALSTMNLVAFLIWSSFLRSYLRHYHRAEERGELRATTAIVVRIYWLTSAGLLALCVVGTVPLAWMCGIGLTTAMAAGVFTVLNRWRQLTLEVHNLRRDRRSFALNASAWQLSSAAAMIAFVYFLRPTAALAFWGNCVATLALVVVATGPFLRRHSALPDTAPCTYWPVVRSFGVPFTALLVLQWIQGFTDRYLVAFELGRAEAGLYVAAFQVCGVPYMFFQMTLDSLIKPIAYQRARDINDPAQIWSADKVLLGGLLVYGVFGGLMLIVYLVFGPRLMTLLTSSEYQLTAITIFALAAGRFVQNGGFLLQQFFEVHHAMTTSFAVRALGAIVTVPAVWLFLRLYGNLFGAAVGILVPGLLYIALLSFGPNGAAWLVWRNRQRLIAARVAAAQERI